jgi:hypothetical protein
MYGRTISFFLIVRPYRAGVNFVWEQMRAGKRGGKRAIKRGIAISIIPGRTP